MGDIMPSDHYHQDIRSLSEALNRFIRENPRLVSDIASHTDRTTPLHVSASRGHLALAKSLLSQEPWLATARDCRGQTPLHLASVEGHVDVVKALLGTDPCQLCLAQDNGGRIPLHLAVMRGKYAVVTELVGACPESLYVPLEGDTVLHLAVKYNQLQTLKELVRLAEEKDYYSGILTEGDREGNTVLHLAALLDKIEMVEHLLKSAKIKSEATKTLNKEGFNALDALENKLDLQYLNTDSQKKNTKQLLEVLKKGGVRSNQEVPAKTWKEMIFHFIKKINTFLTTKAWMAEARAQLIVVSTIITTITYQVAVNPPGGVFQVSYTDMQNQTTLNMLNETQRCQRNFTHYNKDCQLPGNAVSGYFNPTEFAILTVFNTGAFLGSLCVTVVLASGFPLRNPLVLSFFNLCVIFTLESLMITFLLSVDLSNPMLLRSPVGLIVSWDSFLALGVFSVFLTLNTLVLTWGLYAFLPLVRIKAYITSARNYLRCRRQNGTTTNSCCP